VFDELMRAGWPAIEEVDVDGWVARFSDGVTNRANSVLPFEAPADVGPAIERVEALYAERGLPAVFQIGPDAQPARLDQVLEARGYELGSPTAILTIDIDRPSTHDVDITEAPTREWLELWWAVDGRGDAAALATAETILTGGPALYATISDHNGAAAVGRLALVGEWGGVYCLAVREDARQQGLGATILDGLLAAGQERGVKRSWLQVRAENTPARRLYQRAGYTEVARYHYRSHRRQEPVQNIDAEA
jgi:ribosomal protein S18 acetylase RimI-like enzyme